METNHVKSLRTLGCCFIHELEHENDCGAVETSFLFLIACFYDKMFYLELITS